MGTALRVALICLLLTTVQCAVHVCAGVYVCWLPQVTGHSAPSVVNCLAVSFLLVYCLSLESTYLSKCS